MNTTVFKSQLIYVATEKMSIIELPSPSKINRAGQILRNEASSSDLREAAIDLLYKLRCAHSYILSAIYKKLEEQCSRLKFSNVIIAQRIKCLKSIESKLRRYSIRLSKMQDLAGLRVILPSTNEIRKLHERMQQTLPHSKSTDYIASPKSDGYRGIHMILEFQNENQPELNGLKAEIQLRTRLQHAFATTVETLGVIEHQDFKSGLGDENYKRFFMLASALIAIAEKTAIADDLKGYSALKLAVEFERLERHLDIFNRLRQASIEDSKDDTTETIRAPYHLLNLNATDKVITRASYTESKILDAIDIFSHQEKQQRSSQLLTLVSVRGNGSLHETYPNYFLDASIFINELQQICNTIKKAPH